MGSCFMFFPSLTCYSVGELLGSSPSRIHVVSGHVFPTAGMV